MMRSDFEIGRVVAVDTAQVTIELNRDLKALTRSTYEGAYEIGRINSYVILPVGARRLVAMVTRVVLTEEAEVTADRTMVTLPAARRLMKATLIGTIDGLEYTQGVTIFPVLDNPVHMATEADLAIIFDHGKGDELPKAEDPGFCIRIGESPIFAGYPIKINPDAFFGKHAAIIGSTGSGKSCTVASLIQSILSRDEVRRSHIVILDTNGEYQEALPAAEYSTLHIPSDPNKPAERLAIPYWFMNADDFVRLFRAKEGLQAPVLLRALRLARAESAGSVATATAVETLRTSLAQILAITENDSPAQQNWLAKHIRDRCDDALGYRETFPQYVASLDALGGASTFDTFETAIRSIKQIAEEAHPPGRDFATGALGATRLQRIRNSVEPVLSRLNNIAAGSEAGVPDVSADWPVFFDKTAFLESALDTAMKEQAESGSPGRIREACGPMFVRVRRFFEDPRFRFLFGMFPKHNHALATFLRDLLGLATADPPTPALSNQEAVPVQALPYYDRQRAGSSLHKVVVLDLSLLTSEVLENVTALIGRLILEFLQRLGEAGGAAARGSLPIVLVLEEAQNYIREKRFGDEESISRDVFERIAREGRKYGLSLVVTSQRPSELSKTVLSQCNSFVVHRLQNPEDLRYFKDIVPGIYGPLLDQLPALAPQTALILGECVRAPALVRIREARPVPRSRDPKFYQHWVADVARDPVVEEICALWEGQTGDHAK